MSLLQYSNYDRCDMASLIRSHASEIDCVIVAGGDGSINAALEGLVATGLPLGILPFGTGNDFARTLGIPVEPAAAASLVIQGDTRSVDVGEINGHFFINVASIGLSVELTRYLTGTLKRRWGRLAYPIAAAKALARTRPFTVRITGGGRSLDVRSLQTGSITGPEWRCMTVRGLMISASTSIAWSQLIFGACRCPLPPFARAATEPFQASGHSVALVQLRFTPNQHLP